MVHDTVSRMLNAWGYLSSPIAEGADYDQAVKEFQRFNQLKPDGIVGPVTTRAIDARFCGVPDILKIEDSQCRWNNPDITWRVVGELPNLSREQMIDAFARAWKAWGDVCGLNPKFVEGAGAEVVMQCGRIDSPGRTLAWSELVVCPNSWRKQMYDTSEPWSTVIPIPPHTISLETVAIHEIGHVLGWVHDSSNQPSIMKPIYDPRVTQLQPIDVQRAVEVYGPPINPVPPNDAECVVRIGTEQYQGRLTKIQ